MKNVLLLFILFNFFTNISFSQSPLEAPLPSKFNGMKEGLIVNQFPYKVYATTDEDRKDYTYFWKHNTAVLSPTRPIQVTECGAYIFYNDQWNLRVSYSTQEFVQLFQCPKGKMKPGQPYTFMDNWRTDNRLTGGWAMWYFIGETEDGEKVYGVGRVETVGELGF